MGQISGDKSRHNRNRRKKIARRVEMRALQAKLGVTTAPSPAAKPAAARKAAADGPSSSEA